MNFFVVGVLIFESGILDGVAQCFWFCQNPTKRMNGFKGCFHTSRKKNRKRNDLKSMSQRSDGEFSNPFCGTILPSQLLCIGSASQITELIIECGKKGEFDADRHIGVILYSSLRCHC